MSVNVDQLINDLVAGSRDRRKEGGKDADSLNRKMVPTEPDRSDMFEQSRRQHEDRSPGNDAQPIHFDKKKKDPKPQKKPKPDTGSEQVVNPEDAAAPRDRGSPPMENKAGRDAGQVPRGDKKKNKKKNSNRKKNRKKEKQQPQQPGAIDQEDRLDEEEYMQLEEGEDVVQEDEYDAYDNYYDGYYEGYGNYDDYDDANELYPGGAGRLAAVTTTVAAKTVYKTTTIVLDQNHQTVPGIVQPGDFHIGLGMPPNLPGAPSAAHALPVPHVVSLCLFVAFLLAHQRV
ncbi:hypothetical protein BC940DRAFT_287311 [Gongronella butleri]|nr:hypothetical protein BC940DRAFT_287311 [Gongronella butleri]